MKKLYARHSQKVQYLLIGGWNTVFGYAAFTILYYYGTVRFQLHYIIPLLLSHIVSVTSAYFAYKRFVFKTKGNFAKEYYRFCTFYWFALAANLIILPALVGLLGLDPVISQGLFTIAAAGSSYCWHTYYSFSPVMSVKKSELFSR